MADISKRVLRVFLSSPGDVVAHRNVVREVIARLNSDPLVSERCFIEIASWDAAHGGSVPLSATRTPQASVNDYVTVPRECDLTIVLLWSRLGTPMPEGVRRADGSAFQSGTVWELEDALDAGREVWIYRDLRRPQIDIDDPDEEQKKDQYRRLRDFVGSARAPDGSLRFGLHEFNREEELRDWVSEHLRQFVRKTVPREAGSAREPAAASAPVRRPVYTPTYQSDDHIGRLLNLCDREDARDMLTGKMRERVKLSRPRQPLMCVLPGGTRQGHRGFLERIREYEVRSQLPGIGPEHIALIGASGKLPIDNPQMLGVSILRALREGVKEPGLDSWKDLQKWMAQEERKILLLALEPTTDTLRGKEAIFLRNAAQWMAAWVGKPSRHLFVMVACVRFATETRWLGPDPASERARIAEVIGEFCAQPGGELSPELLQLPELPAITREDVENWLDHEVVRQLVSPRVRKIIETVFDERPTWSMDDLRDRLGTQ